MSTIDRFLSKINKTEGCWLFTGCRNKKGYGLFWLGITRVGGMTAAHRFAYETFNGPITAGLMVLHSCDNPPCVNPAHLFLGTALDNNLDRQRKGRSATGDRSGSRTKPQSRPRGEQAARSVLTADDVRTIRATYGIRTGAELAAEYGIAKPTVYNIVARRIWKHI
jgi:hypothetical protein